MASQWAVNMNEGNLTGLVLLDICKAFDMVDHDILLQNLSLYRLSDTSLQWFRIHLTDRQQIVRFNDRGKDCFTPWNSSSYQGWGGGQTVILQRIAAATRGWGLDYYSPKNSSSHH